MAPGYFKIRAKKENEKNKKKNRRLHSPAYYNKFYMCIKPAVAETGDKYEEYIPKIIHPCKKCENGLHIDGNVVMQSSCFCEEILPVNYLTKVLSADEIHREMSFENDLSW